MPGMRRREFITLLGGAAAAWPLAARAQQAERVRRIGVLMALPRTTWKDKPAWRRFVQGLQQLGWTDGRNVRIDIRWGGGNAGDIRKFAAELVALAPDVILASSSAAAPQCCRRPAPFRSCSRLSSTRSAPASSTAWRGRAATPPALPLRIFASAANGWSCSRRSRRA